MGDNYRIILRDMPTTVKAVTITNSDGTFTIFINSRLAYEQQCKSFDHEINHIMNCDFEKEQDINVLEYESHYNYKK